MQPKPNHEKVTHKPEHDAGFEVQPVGYIIRFASWYFTVAQEHEKNYAYRKGSRNVCFAYGDDLRGLITVVRLNTVRFVGIDKSRFTLPRVSILIPILLRGEAKRVCSGDVAMGKALIGSKIFCRKVRVTQLENPITVPGLLRKMVQ